MTVTTSLATSRAAAGAAAFRILAAFRMRIVSTTARPGAFAESMASSCSRSRSRGRETIARLDRDHELASFRAGARSEAAVHAAVAHDEMNLKKDAFVDD